MNLLDGADPLNVDDLRDEFTNKWKDKSAEELLKAKVESDLHIKTLEREKAEMYEMYKQVFEENKTKASINDLLDQWKKEKETQVAAPSANEVKVPELDLTKVKQTASETYAEMRRREREEENFSRVQTKLQERFGSNYASILKDQYNQLGLSNEDMNALAVKSPEAYFRMLGLNDQPRDSYQAPPRTNQRNDSFAPKVQKRDYAYYAELKKTNPLLYLDPKISAQMERDMMELGPAFGLPD